MINKEKLQLMSCTNFHDKNFLNKIKNTKSCGVNASTGRCKRGAPKDQDMCI